MRKPDVFDLAARLRKARTDLGWSQAHLAGVLGVRQATVSNWEQGHTMPAADQLAEIARALRVSSDDLLGLNAHDEAAARRYRAALRDGLFLGEAALRELRREHEDGEPTSGVDPDAIRGAVDRTRGLLGPGSQDDQDTG
jgi:transcriptional regulator with XRE-family HTH domain